MNDSDLLKMFKLPVDVGIYLMLEDIKDVSLRLSGHMLVRTISSTHHLHSQILQRMMSSTHQFYYCCHSPTTNFILHRPRIVSSEWGQH
jgi:hypothetical protein